MQRLQHLIDELQVAIPVLAAFHLPSRQAIARASQSLRVHYDRLRPMLLQVDALEVIGGISVPVKRQY
jgi:hypothetical protein